MAKNVSSSAKKASTPPPPPTPAKAQAPKPAAATPAQPTSSVESKGQPKAQSATAKNITREDIALAAYIRWEKFGGDAETNWALAERELRGQ